MPCNKCLTSQTWIVSRDLVREGLDRSVASCRYAGSKTVRLSDHGHEFFNAAVDLGQRQTTIKGNEFSGRLQGRHVIVVQHRALNFVTEVIDSDPVSLGDTASSSPDEARRI